VTDTATRARALLAETPPFDGLAEEERGDLLEAALVAGYASGDRVLPQGEETHEHLYVVAEGHIRLVDVHTGRLIDECGEGDTFGSFGLLRGGPRPYEARAAEPTTCVLIPAPAFHAAYRADPAFAAFFDTDLGRYAGTLRQPADVVGARLLLQTTLGELVTRSPVTATPSTSVREAAQAMRDAGVGSIVVTEGERPLGILTNTDLRDRVVVDGADPETPVEELMSAPVRSKPASALVFDGLMALVEGRMHHLVVTDAGGERLVGVVSDQDIARARGSNPATLVKRIETARAVSDLTGVRSELTGLLLRLHQQGVEAEDLVAVNTAVNDRLATRVLALVDGAVRDEMPDDAVDLPWVWLALGSEGREEMSLKTDQDNGILYADPADADEARRAERFFTRFADRANIALDAVGFDLCLGGVMARNPRWRMPLKGWKRQFRRWIFEPDELALMHASIFFDLRGLTGHLPLAEALKADLSDALDAERGFLPFLMRNALDTTPPLSIFRRFVVERSGEHVGTFDLKRRGLMPLVDLGRVLALDARYLASTNTLDRYAHVRDVLPRIAGSADNAADAYRFLLDLRLGHQLAQAERGEMPDNHLAPEALSKVQQQMLKAAFAAIADLQGGLAHRYGAELMR
jgi:CBS domain-containing protein